MDKLATLRRYPLHDESCPCENGIWYVTCGFRMDQGGLGVFVDRLPWRGSGVSVACRRGPGGAVETRWAVPWCRRAAASWRRADQPGLRGAVGRAGPTWSTPDRRVRARVDAGTRSPSVVSVGVPTWTPMGSESGDLLSTAHRSGPAVDGRHAAVAGSQRNSLPCSSGAVMSRSRSASRASSGVFAVMTIVAAEPPSTPIRYSSGRPFFRTCLHTRSAARLGNFAAPPAARWPSAWINADEKFPAMKTNTICSVVALL